MKRVLFLMPIVCLSACTQYWNKPGATLQSTAGDLYQCRMDGAKANQGGRIIFTAAEIEGTCMSAKGYKIGATPPAQ